MVMTIWESKFQFKVVRHFKRPSKKVRPLHYLSRPVADTITRAKYINTSNPKQTAPSGINDEQGKSPTPIRGRILRSLISFFAFEYIRVNNAFGKFFACQTSRGPRA